MCCSFKNVSTFDLNVNMKTGIINFDLYAKKFSNIYTEELTCASSNQLLKLCASCYLESQFIFVKLMHLYKRI